MDAGTPLLDTPNAAAAAGGLDLHEGNSDPRTQREHSSVDGTLLWEPIPEGLFSDELRSDGACTRWPENLRLLSSQGEMVRGRCKSTNQCRYCARLGAVENAEVLALDALHGVAPSVWMVLTSRDPSTDPARFYDSRRQVLKALRLRWPSARAATITEFSTGEGRRSAGKRRPHFNVMVKGISPADVDEVRDVAVGVWCGREDAEPQAQHVGTISEMGGLMKYLALHFQKESQQPPKGWRGHRFTQQKGYLWTDTTAAREAARASLRAKRALWKALQAGHTGLGAEAVAAAELELAAATSWRLVDHNPVHAL